MSSQRTVTKVIFRDSSDDETDGPTTTTYIDVRTDMLCMEEADMADPDELSRACGGDDECDANADFVEDTMPNLEKAKGTLSYNHISTVEVNAMEAPSRRTGGFNNRQRLGRKPDDVSTAHSVKRRLGAEEDGEDIVGETIVSEKQGNDGMTTEEMVEAASIHGLPEIGFGTADALTAIEEEVVKAVMLPNGTNRDPLAVKMSTEGYRLTLDENDVQDVFEDEEEAFEEEEDEDDDELQLLMAVSAIEQLIGACERYQPMEEDGGMCPWAKELALNADETSIPNTCESNASAGTVESCTSPTLGADADSADVSAQVATHDEDDKGVPKRRVIYRPVIFDKFVEKGKDLLAKLSSNEISGDELCDAMAADIEAVQRAFRRINRPADEPIFINGVKMDF